MRAVFGGSLAGARKIDGQDLRDVPSKEQRTENPPERLGKSVRNGGRIRFADLARFAWPNKTEANLAFHLKVDPRTARRWLADDNEPPADALGVVLTEIMKRFHQRD